MNKSVAALALVGLSLISLSLPLAQAQTQAAQPLNNAQALALYTRTLQLIDSTMFAVPDLARAGAPLLESAKQSVADLRLSPGNALIQYKLLNSAKAYLTLSDAIPKPTPFPEAGQKQFNELRESVDQIDAHFRSLLEQKDHQLRSPDPDNVARYAELDARMGAPQATKPRVVFMGDSITDAWRLNEYFPDRDFVNRGISGQTTPQMLGRMEPDVIALQPSAVLILAGTNDLARGTPLSIIESNLIAMASMAECHKIHVILSTVLPVSDYHKDVNPAFEMTRQRPPELIRALNTWMQTFCGQHNYTFLDYYSDMVDAAGRLKPDLSEDGLHPNAMGYRIMAPLALAAIDKAAAAPPPPKQTPKKRRLFWKTEE